MLKLFSAAAVLVVSAFATQAAPISVINGSHNVINGYGLNNDGIAGRGFTATSFADSGPGWAAALAAGNTIVIEQAGVDAAPIPLLTSFMNMGGRIIALGDSRIDTQLINPLFGTSLNISSGSAGQPWALTAAAVGTTFEGGPADLNVASSTHPTLAGTVPAGSTIFYGTSTNAQVFRTPVGMGDFFYIGHDYCCGSLAAEEEYLDVLASAIDFDGGTMAPIPLPASAFLLFGALGGLIATKRREA